MLVLIASEYMFEDPVLNAAAEQGEPGWSHLREVVRVAVPETEEAWLAMARTYAWKVFHRVVSQAIRGDLPGQASQPAEAEQVEVHAHHLTLYCQGGLSVPPGMVLLCTRCHRNVHRGTLRIHGTPDSGLDWRDARGLPLGRATAPARQGAVTHAVRLVATAIAAAAASRSVLARGRETKSPDGAVRHLCSWQARYPSIDPDDRL